jgi:hypothetical protein
MKLYIVTISAVLLFGCNKAKIESRPTCNNVMKEIKTVLSSPYGTFYTEKDSIDGSFLTPYDTVFTNSSFYYIKDTIREILRTEKYRYLYLDYNSTPNKVHIGQINRKDTVKITNVGNEWKVMTNLKYITLKQQFTTNNYGVSSGWFQHKDLSLAVENTYSSNGFLNTCISTYVPNATRLTIPVTNDFIRDINNNIIQIKSSSSRQSSIVNITYYLDNQGTLPFNSIDYFQGFTSELLKPFFMSKSSTNLPKKIIRDNGETLNFEYKKDSYGRVSIIYVTQRFEPLRYRNINYEIKIIYECQ